MQKDVRTFTEQYTAVYKDLYRFAYYTLGEPQAAEDAVSEAVLAAFEHFHELRNPSAFRSWIFRILSNVCKHKLRLNYAPVDPLEDDIPTEDPDIELRCDLKTALKTLSKEERLIISLSVFSGYKGEELAEMLHMNHSTLRSKYRRAMEKLRRLL